MSSFRTPGAVFNAVNRRPTVVSTPNRGPLQTPVSSHHHGSALREARVTNGLPPHNLPSRSSLNTSRVSPPRSYGDSRLPSTSHPSILPKKDPRSTDKQSQQSPVAPLKTGLVGTAPSTSRTFRNNGEASCIHSGHDERGSRVGSPHAPGQLPGLDRRRRVPPSAVPGIASRAAEQSHSVARQADLRSERDKDKMRALTDKLSTLPLGSRSRRDILQEMKAVSGGKVLFKTPVPPEGRSIVSQVEAASRKSVTQTVAEASTKHKGKASSRSEVLSDQQQAPVSILFEPLVTSSHLTTHSEIGSFGRRTPPIAARKGQLAPHFMQ